VRVLATGNVAVGATGVANTILHARHAAQAYWNGGAFVNTPQSFVTITNGAAGGYDAGVIAQMSDSGGTAQNSFVIGTVGTGPWTAGTASTQTCDLYLGVRNNAGGMTERLRINGVSGECAPGADNAQTLGGAARRWSTIYAVTGTVNTSDERAKRWRGAMTRLEQQAARAIIDELGFFQWDDAVGEKGAGQARLHFGARAQRVWAMMAQHGLVDAPSGAQGDAPQGAQADATTAPAPCPMPTSRYAFLCWDDDGQGGRFGLRIDQLALFLIAAFLPMRRIRPMRGNGAAGAA
ncbi:MAG: tail fiber domain-containing protein, partial [Sphingopyxis sp.]